MEKQLAKIQPKSLDNISEIAKNIATEDADDLAVMQYLAQETSALQLLKLRKLEESKIPTGAKSFEWTITTTTKRIDLGLPWISFSLHNDGPGNVRMRINKLEGDISAEATVDSGEVISRDFEYPIVTRIYLVTESGTATVRVYAEEGRWV